MRPAQHYTMGGVRTDHTGQSPNLKGLFAAGEAACWDMHGFNRLGGNSVAETVVAGMIVGEYIADFCDRLDNDVDIPTALGPRIPAIASRASSTRWSTRSGSEDASAIKARMQDLMTAKVGIFRRGEDLQAAVDELQQLLQTSRNIGLRDKSPRREPRARHRVPGAEDAEARAVHRLRRAGAHREPRCALPARTTRGATTPSG